MSHILNTSTVGFLGARPDNRAYERWATLEEADPLVEPPLVVCWISNATSGFIGNINGMLESIWSEEPILNT